MSDETTVSEEMNIEDAFGQSAFTDEEIEADRQREEQRRREYEEKLKNGFFTDGGHRKIVIEFIGKQEKVSQKGKAYVLYTYHLKDAETGEQEKVVDANFAFTNALQPVKKELGVALKLGVTILAMDCVKDGEREWQGVNYPVWKFKLELADNNTATKPTPEPFV